MPKLNSNTLSAQIVCHDGLGSYVDGNGLMLSVQDPTPVPRCSGPWCIVAAWTTASATPSRSVSPTLGCRVRADAWRDRRRSPPMGATTSWRSGDQSCRRGRISYEATGTKGGRSTRRRDCRELENCQQRDRGCPTQPDQPSLPRGNGWRSMLDGKNDDYDGRGDLGVAAVVHVLDLLVTPVGL